MQQSPSFIILVSPDHFGFNPETAFSNSFQNEGTDDVNTIREKAIEEHHGFALILEKNKIDFKIFSSSPSGFTPDAVFPNNWFSVHHDGRIVLYPMLAVNRRRERNPEIIEWIKKQFGHNQVMDLTEYEMENKFLEGTGSIVFHHPSRTAFASISSRTNEEVLQKICGLTGYTSYVFSATDQKNKEIYHTNVLLTITSDLAIICSEVINDLLERTLIMKKLEDCGLKIVEISITQMHNFAGNMFEVINSDEMKKLLMSEKAYYSLKEEQLSLIKKYSEPVVIPVTTIEHYGGGSVRCMVAGIFGSRL